MWTLEFACALIALHYVLNLLRFPEYRLRQMDRLRVAVGLMTKCAGWGVHQFYWWIWEHAGGSANVALKSTLEAWAPITILAYTLVIAGEALVISPYAAHVGGRGWVLLIGAFVSALLLIGYLIATI